MIYKIQPKQYIGGLPSGGEAGQVLQKTSSGNFDTEWADPGSVDPSVVIDAVNDFLNTGNLGNTGVSANTLAQRDASSGIHAYNVFSNSGNLNAAFNEIYVLNLASTLSTRVAADNENLREALRFNGTPPGYVSAEGELTASTIANNDTVTINGIEYTFVTALGVAFDVLVGVDTDDSLNNLTTAIVAGPGEGVTYGTGTTAHPDVTASGGPGLPMTVTAIIAGTVGNAITTTSNLTAGSFGGGTLSGGIDGSWTMPTNEYIGASSLPDGTPDTFTATTFTFGAGSAAAFRTALGAGTTGGAVFLSETGSSARTNLGAGATGSSIFTSATPSAAWTAFGAFGTITASTPATVTQTWNNAAVTFTAQTINVTDTTSATASLLQDWQIAGVSKLSIRKDGAIISSVTNSGVKVIGTGVGYGLTLGGTGVITSDTSYGSSGALFQLGYDSDADGNVLRMGRRDFSYATRYYLGGGSTTGLKALLGAWDCPQGYIINSELRLSKFDSSTVEINNGTASTFRDLKVRNVIQSPGVGTTVTPAANGDLVFEVTSNTSVTVKLKGSDGTVRSVVLTLA